MHSADLAKIDVTELDGIPVTALPRTLMDLAATLSAARLAQVLRRAEESGVFDLGPIDALLRRSVGHRGAPKLHAALDIYRVEPAFTRSGLERRFRELVKAAKLPLPSMNFVVDGFELDAYWERERFVVELDIYETHGTHDAFERDRLRQDDLLLIGVEMIRVTGPRLRREPAATIDRVAAHLKRRRHELPEREVVVCRPLGDK